MDKMSINRRLYLLQTSGEVTGESNTIHPRVTTPKITNTRLMSECLCYLFHPQREWQRREWMVRASGEPQRVNAALTVLVARTKRGGKDQGTAVNSVPYARMGGLPWPSYWSASVLRQSVEPPLVQSSSL